MNLPQVGSVVVIFSLVLLLGFGSIDIAEAKKASGVYVTEINSKAVCGDRLCDTPMTIEEKIAEFRGESEELVTRGGDIITTGTSMMMEFAGGLADEIGGPIGGILFDTIFPSGDDDRLEELLEGMEDRLTEHIDKQFEEQTSILLGAILDMQFSISESIKEQSDNADLKRARETIDTWHTLHKRYINYLAFTDDSNDQKADELEKKWGEKDFETNVISNLIDKDKLSLELRIEGFPLYWMGQLMFIAYSQDQAQLANPENPNNTDHAQNIKDTVASMKRQLDTTKDDETEFRLSHIGQVVCWEQGGHDVTQYDIKLIGLGGNIMDSFEFKGTTGYYCLFTNHETDEKYEGWSDKKWSLGAMCPLNVGMSAELEAEGWIAMKDSGFCINTGIGTLYVLPVVEPSDDFFSSPITPERLKDWLENERNALKWKFNNELDEKFEPYYDAMKDLENLRTTPVPEIIITEVVRFGFDGMIEDTAVMDTPPPLVCPLGQFAAPGDLVCTDAPAGSFVNTTGATSSILCPAGTYQPDSGQSLCISCPIKTASEPGAISCMVCPQCNTAGS